MPCGPGANAPGVSWREPRRCRAGSSIWPAAACARRRKGGGCDDSRRDRGGRPASLPRRRGAAGGRRVPPRPGAQRRGADGLHLHRERDRQRHLPIARWPAGRGRDRAPGQPAVRGRRAARGRGRPRVPGEPVERRPGDTGGPGGGRMTLQDLSYNEFGALMMREGGVSRLPLSGSFELTFKCNLRCVHCYIPDYSGRNEMSTEEIKRILSEAADEGCVWMLLTGGEILCRSDFPEIYLHAKRQGFLLTLFSNGTLLDERIADLLAEDPPFGIEITLYGLSDATYLKTTGFPRPFTRVRRAIDLMLERRLPLSLKAVAMEPLRGEIEKMAAFCDSLGVRFRYDAIVHGRLDGSLAPTQVRSSPDTVVEYDATDPERFAEWLKFYKQYVKPTRPSPYLMSCGAGVNSFHVTPQGLLLSCEALPLLGYDLRRGSFREGWYGVVADIRERRAEVFNVCAACELKALCDRCPATALLETGSPDGWIPYYCEVTHRRAALLEDMSGNAETAARYREHAERVAAGWTPPGAILPRASALGATGGCGAGACASGGCGKAAVGGERAPQLLQIERPGAHSGESKETQ